MSNDFWDKGVSDYDLVKEGIEDNAQEILDELEDADEEEYEEEIDYDYEDEEETMSDYEPTKAKVAYKLDKRESGIVSESMIRLEQARLYDMLIKHDLFKGVKAHPKALQNVQNEVKKYIVKRLEVLLGIRGEESETLDKKSFEVDIPFNDIEIDFLKSLSGKGTKGASNNYHTEITTIPVREINKKVPKKQLVVEEEYEEEHEEELQPLSSQENYEEEYVEPPKPKVKKRPVKKTKRAAVRQKPAQKQKPVRSQNVEKYKPSKAKLMRNNHLSDEEAERIAREDIERMKGRKPVDKMSPKELMEANKRIRSNKFKSDNAKPIPQGAQLDMHYRTKQMNQTSNPDNSGFNSLLNKILSEKK